MFGDMTLITAQNMHLAVFIGIAALTFSAAIATIIAVLRSK